MNRHAHHLFNRYFLGITWVFVVLVSLPLVLALSQQKQTSQGRAAPAEQQTEVVIPNQSQQTQQPKREAGLPQNKPAATADQDTSSIIGLLLSPQNRQTTIGFSVVVGSLFIGLIWVLIKGRPNWKHYSNGAGDY